MYESAIRELIRHYYIKNNKEKEEKFVKLYIKLLSQRNSKYDQKYYESLNRYLCLLKSRNQFKKIVWVKKELSEFLYIDLQQRIKTTANPASILNSFGMTFKNVINDYRRAEECYKKALELDPFFASCYNNYALLFTSIKKDDNKADNYYLKALELNSADPVLLGNYAFFLQNARRNFSEAEVCYQEALRINNSEQSNLANFASFKLIMGDIEEAKQLASKSLMLCIPSPGRFPARPLFVLIIIRMFECKNCYDLIGNMKFLFNHGMEHVPWDNRELMNFAKKVLDSYEYQFLQKIFNTINDYSSMENLINISEWDDTPPQPFVNNYSKE